MTIGKMIVKLRKEKKISQEKLAELLGISRQTLSNYENDITSPDLEQATKLCQIFDISLDLLVGNNTLSSKISSTERIIKKQYKDMKIILITLYVIIMLALVFYIVYAFTNKDFTDEYQIEYTCVNKNKESIIVSLESKMIDKKYNTDRFFDETRASDFTLITKEYHDGEYGDEVIIFAGDSIGEALDSLEKAKKLLIGNGYKCY